MIKNILEEYGISSYKIETLKGGLINETYKIKTLSKSFILQKMNSIYDTNVIDDIEHISKYTNKKGIHLPQIIPTKNGKLFIKINDDIWRMFSYISGTVYNNVPDADISYEAGKILGKFHSSLRGCVYTFKSKLPIGHQSEKIFERFKKAIVEARENDTEINNLIEKIYIMPNFYIKYPLTKIITHGDPKINNIIFNKNKAVALIDIDGCNINAGLIELGCALRSWCGKSEDDINNYFSINKFESALIGYIETFSGIIPKKEFVFLPQIMKLMVLELASKFLRDYYLDTYFDWDRKKFKSRKEHNLVRAKGQISLFESIVKNEKEISGIISKLLKK